MWSKGQSAAVGAMGNAAPRVTGPRATCSPHLGWTSFPPQTFPPPCCSSARDNWSLRCVPPSWLGSPTPSKPLCSSTLSSSALLLSSSAATEGTGASYPTHLCSAVDLPLPPPPFLAHGPLAPRLFVISLPVIPTSPWKALALAILVLMSHRLRHHSGGEKTLGNKGQMAALPDKEQIQCLYSRRAAICFTYCPKLWNKTLSSDADTASKADICSMS